MKAVSIAMMAAVAGFAAPAVAQAPATPAGYVAAAGAGDLYERQSSQLVLQTTADPKVRSFAQMMLTDHAKSTAQVKAAAARAKVPVAPPKLMPDQSKMIADLRAQSGTARDAAYVAQQKTAHQKALALHRGYADAGTSAPLKAAAAGIAPVVQHHIEMLNAM
ncbi:DUF4142 domain-containing protein [Sphingomonas adhaesiva]|uniref:DUF4142 domain-containing protein n=1 Tax=Sphingomonas adhaesiva TaxID=28212 RepID=UPI002FFA28E1